MSEETEDTMTPEQMRERIEKAPLPGDGEPIHSREGESIDLYGLAAESAAHAMLVVAEENPTLLDVPSREEDPSGFEAADNMKLWEAVEAKWPDADKWWGGITGFQYGWAHGAARYVLGREPVGNPAIVTIKEGDDEDES